MGRKNDLLMEVCKNAQRRPPTMVPKFSVRPHPFTEGHLSGARKGKHPKGQKNHPVDLRERWGT